MAVRSSRKAKRLSWEMRAKGPFGGGAGVGVAEGGAEQPTRAIKVIVISISRSQKLAGDRQIRRLVAGSGDPAGANWDLLSMRRNLDSISCTGVYNGQMSPFSLISELYLIIRKLARERRHRNKIGDCLCSLDTRLVWVYNRPREDRR